MPYSIKRRIKGKKKPSFKNLTKPMKKALKKSTPLKSRGNRSLQMTLEDQLNALVLFHLEEHASAQHLLQVLKEDDFARKNIAPKNGIEKSSFSEAVNTRGLKQFIEVFEEEANKIGRVDFLAQGTLYPDVIESAASGSTASAKIKSHHNVGGLPARMRLSLIEPLRYLFKDEVRQVGLELGMPEEMDLKSTSSLGLNLVTMLVEDQLHGEIKLDKKGGTAFHFRLRMKK